MGWILIHDRNNVFASEATGALKSLSQRLIGSNTLVQGALPNILRKTPQSFFDDTIGQVQANAEIAYEKLKKCPGLHPIQPKGAMYMMIGIDMARYPEFATEFQFVERMVSEQSVFCLPGKCFEYPDYFRIVLTLPEDKMLEALDRIREFCEAHYYHRHISRSEAKRVDENSSVESTASEESSSEDEQITMADMGKATPLGSSFHPQSQATRS